MKRIAFFDTKPYDKLYFDKLNESLIKKLPRLQRVMMR